jgi:K+-transporting ATPase ATPase C chain
MVHNPSVERTEIPSDLVTASGSGLDPNISVQSALVQVPRIAKLRKISPIVLEKLVEQQTEKPFLGSLGTSKINVLKLNLALNELLSK